MKFLVFSLFVLLYYPMRAYYLYYRKPINNQFSLIEILPLGISILGLGIAHQLIVGVISLFIRRVVPFFIRNPILPNIPLTTSIFGSGVLKPHLQKAMYPLLYMFVH